MREKTATQWAELCDPLNTSKITKGSLFEQDESWLATGGAKPAGMDELASTLKTRKETKYLVKWANLAFIHCTWETRHDLEAETVPPLSSDVQLSRIGSLCSAAQSALL